MMVVHMYEQTSCNSTRSYHGNWQIDMIGLHWYIAKYFSSTTKINKFANINHEILLRKFKKKIIIKNRTHLKQDGDEHIILK